MQWLIGRGGKAFLVAFSQMSQLNVAVVGLFFGAEFVPLYLAHPGIGDVFIFDTVPEKMDEVAAKYPGVRRAPSFDAILQDESVDAVHLLTPLLLHHRQTLEVLNAGKHCACAVTMGMTVDELREIVATVDRTGKTHMMMETGVYTAEFLLAKELRDSGKLGKITFLRGDYYQDLEAPYQSYWKTVPPMLYATHVVGPILAMAQTRAAKVSCVGANRLRKDICEDPHNPFPFQTATVRLEGTDAVAQVNRAWYQTAHEYVESFSVYGEEAGFEWQQLDVEYPVVYELEPVQTETRWRNAQGKRVEARLRPELYPATLEPYAAGWHGGSHPHLVHEFISAIQEERLPFGHARMAADWCAVGIVAHESSLRDGEWLDIPRF